jgi:hypothetical protein
MSKFKVQKTFKAQSEKHTVPDLFARKKKVLAFVI